MTSKTLFGKLALAGCTLIAAIGIGRAQTVTITDIGLTIPTPGALDVAQTNYAANGQNPAGLNYYFDNANPPGSTFVTQPGSAHGYILNSVAIKTMGDSGTSSSYSTSQTYVLSIYSVTYPPTTATTNATLLGAFTSQAFTFTQTNWLQFTGVNLPLDASVTNYAYTIHRSATGWENLGNTNGLVGTTSHACTIPPRGGSVVESSDATSSGTFDIGLSLPMGLTIGPVISSVASPTTQGTTFILTAGNVGDNAGNGTYTYQWQTDGGSGNTPTNIPDATFTTLTNDSTAMTVGLTYKYQVVVKDSTLATVTSFPFSMRVYQVLAGTLTDNGTIPPTPGSSDANQLNVAAAQVSGGLNYYNNNGTPPGETFTTGDNVKGYSLNALYIDMADGTSSGTTTVQGYDLRIYSISSDGSTAILLTDVTNLNFSFNYGDWVQWSFPPINLAPNSMYAYTFVRRTTGYAGLATSDATQDWYPGGQLCLIPSGGGGVTYSSTASLDGTFDVVMIPNGVPFLLTLPSATPSPAYALSPVTLTCKPTTPGSFTYQWLTDDGQGNVPPTGVAPIPGATGTNFIAIPKDIYPNQPDYAGYPTNFYFVATRTTDGISVTSSVVTLLVRSASAPVLTDPTPASLITFAGANPTFTAPETGTLPITNQWQFDNGLGGGFVPLTLKTNSTLILNNMQTTNSGNYAMWATNIMGHTNTHSAALTVLADPPAPDPVSQIYANRAYTNSAWAYWRLNETNNPASATVRAYDYSGHGFLATYGSAMTVSNAGPVPPSFPGFDAGELAAGGTAAGNTNAYLTVPSLNLNGKSNVTFLAWIKPNGPQLANAGLLFYRTASDAAGFGFGAGVDHLGYTWNTNAAATYNWDSGLVVADGVWNFVAYVITPTNATIYLGNLNGGTTNFLQSTNAIVHSSESFTGGTILLGGDSSSINRNFNGLICEATLFTNALTTLQVQQYFEAAIGATGLAPTVLPTIVSPGAATSFGVYSGQNVLLTSKTSGTEPIGLQWQSSADGNTWADVPGATANTLLFNPLIVGSTQYHLVATNVVASITNAPVTVVFKALPTAPPGLWTANFLVTNNIVNYNPGVGGTGKYVGRGILGTGTYWNALPDVMTALWTGITVVGNSDYLDDGATHMGVYAQLNNASGYNYSPAAVDPSNITNMLGQYVSIYYSPNALQFFGLPDGTYNLVLIGMDGGWNDRGTMFVVHDAFHGDQTNSTIDVNGVNVLSQGDNFCVFTNIHSSGGTLNVDIYANATAHGGGNTEADFNAAQLQLVSYDPPTNHVTVSGLITGPVVPTNSISLSWTEGMLLTTTNLNSPWTPINSRSPVTMTMTNKAQFFRVQVHP